MADYEIIFRGINLSTAPYCIFSIDGLGSPELRTQEIELPNADGMTFGREFQGMRKWTINGAVKGGSPSTPATGADVAAAWDAMSDLLTLWGRNDVRSTERTITYLQFQRPGRDPVICYGRPDRIDPDTSVSYAGYINYAAVFRQSDSNFYSLEEFSVRNAIAVPYSGGLLYSADRRGILVPLTTTAGTQRTDGVNNQGDTDSWPIITIFGPVLNPRVSLRVDASDLWLVQLKTVLGSNQSIVIDTRPWMRSVTRSDGANIGGVLRGARLNEMVVPPGQSLFIFDGQDRTATSSAEIRFRSAWASL